MPPSGRATHTAARHAVSHGSAACAGGALGRWPVGKSPSWLQSRPSWRRAPRRANSRCEGLGGGDAPSCGNADVDTEYSLRLSWTRRGACKAAAPSRLSLSTPTCSVDAGQGDAPGSPTIPLQGQRARYGAGGGARNFGLARSCTRNTGHYIQHTHAARPGHSFPQPLGGMTPAPCHARRGRSARAAGKAQQLCATCVRCSAPVRRPPCRRCSPSHGVELIPGGGQVHQAALQALAV